MDRKKVLIIMAVVGGCISAWFAVSALMAPGNTDTGVDSKTVVVKAESTAKGLAEYPDGDGYDGGTNGDGWESETRETNEKKDVKLKDGRVITVEVDSDGNNIVTDELRSLFHYEWKGEESLSTGISGERCTVTEEQVKAIKDGVRDYYISTYRTDDLADLDPGNCTVLTFLPKTIKDEKYGGEVTVVYFKTPHYEGAAESIGDVVWEAVYEENPVNGNKLEVNRLGNKYDSYELINSGRYARYEDVAG